CGRRNAGEGSGTARKRRHLAEGTAHSGIVRVGSFDLIAIGAAVISGVAAHGHLLPVDVEDLVGEPMVIKALVVQLERVVVGPACLIAILHSAPGGLVVRSFSGSRVCILL